MPRKRLFSDVNEVGKKLESSGLVSFGRNAYNQVSNNCLKIASEVATMFGYNPLSRQEVENAIHDTKFARLYGFSAPVRVQRRSPAYFVIRSPDNPTDVHVAFEFRGKEYNYGPGVQEGFPIEMRIPLSR